MTKTTREILDNAPMHWRQIALVALCIALNANDGFDVLAISFAAPGIAREWNIDPATLGIVLSMELIGMAVGSVLIGNIADRIGRRPIILACLIVMTLSMCVTVFSSNITMLSLSRIATGLGIGGMLSATSAMVAEYSNAKRRSLNVVLNIAGYSAGAILGGLVASRLLDSGDWRSVFVFGASLTGAAIPFAWFLLVESVDSLSDRQPPGALSKINTILANMQHEFIKALPQASGSQPKRSITALFSKELARPTSLLTLAYFAQIMLFYYVQKWVPKIVVDMGYDDSEAGRVLVAANIGNLASAVLLGVVSQKIPIRPLVIGSMVMGFFAVLIFGSGISDLTQLSLTVAAAAFFINAGVVGMYPIFAETFPAHLRASGIGFAIGLGRGGSAIGPIVAGALFAAGSSLMTVSALMGAGGLIAACMIVLLPRRSTSKSL
ncbi:MAG: MFS transporter [Pseudomonadota bacterium]